MAAFEVAAVLKDLRDIIKKRKEVNRIPYESNVLLKNLPYNDQASIQEDVKLFYTSLSDYLEKWSRSLDGAEIYSWMKFVVVPNFEKDIEPAATFILEHHPAADLEMEQLFDEFSLLEQYTNLYINTNLSRWASEGLSTENRWLEMLKCLREQSRPTPNF